MKEKTLTLTSESRKKKYQHKLSDLWLLRTGSRSPNITQSLHRVRHTEFLEQVRVLKASF